MTFHSSSVALISALTLSIPPFAGAGALAPVYGKRQIGLSAAVFEVLIPLPECATSLSYSFI